MKLHNSVKLVISIVIPILTGLLGSLFTTADTLNNWYANLRKPVFSPPDWIFGPVWTALYIMMGVSVYLIWRKGLDDKVVRMGVVCFIVQLLLNAIWTPLFFGLKSPVLGLIDIFLLSNAIIVTIYVFFQISRWAAILLIPYAGWILFAMVLNASSYILNW